MKFSRKEKQPRMFFLVSRSVQKNAKKVVMKKVNVKKKKKKKCRPCQDSNLESPDP